MSPEEQNDPVWELLKRRKGPEVSPLFSRDVLRTIRQIEPESAPRWGGLLRFALPTLGLAAVVALVSIQLGSPSLRRESPAAPAPLAEAAATLTTDDFDVVAHLDELLASEENLAWLDPQAL